MELHRAKKNPVGSFETSKVLAKIPNQPLWKQWQVDHICDLEIFTQLACADTPPNIKVVAWAKGQDGVFGEIPPLYLDALNSEGSER